MRALALVAFAGLTAFPVAAWSASPAPSEEYYLSECFATGHELGICRCIAKALSLGRNANAELVAAIMKEYILKEGDRAIDPARVKQDLPRLGLTASDAEIATAVAAAAEGSKCQQ
jgi:hypothetical protein